MIKYKRFKKIVTYKGYSIFFDTEYKVYLTALNRDGTDTFFSTLDEAYEAIESRIGE